LGVEGMRASAYDLPFADRFDIASQSARLHHLKDQAGSLQNMVSAVKPNGSAGR
jgi:SAM-dependent methyltransferase